MASSNNVKLEMNRGDSKYLGFELEGFDTLDNATFTAWLNQADDDTIIFQKDLEDGITEVETGKYSVRVAPEDTEDVEAGRYYYKLRIYANNDRLTPIEGALIINP